LLFLRKLNVLGEQFSTLKALEKILVAVSSNPHRAEDGTATLGNK
jgi:hypothetical protein